MTKTNRRSSIPFEVKPDIPNEVTEAAIVEGKRLIRDKNAVGYDNIRDLRAALEV